MNNSLPAITGKQLIRLLRLDGWKEGEHKTHGIGFRKSIEPGRTLIAIVPNKRNSLPIGTLAKILSPQQTQLGRAGLLDLISKHGLK